MATPSISGSTSSTASTRFGGEEMTVEESVVQCIKNVNEMFMALQMEIILLVNAKDQSVDDSTDFRLCCQSEFKVLDIVDGINYCISELPEIVTEFRGTPPSKEDRAWWTAIKAARKIEYAALVSKRKEIAIVEKANRKALMEAEAKE